MNELFMQFINTQIMMNVIHSITDILMLIFIYIMYQKLNKIDR